MKRWLALLLFTLALAHMQAQEDSARCLQQAEAYKKAGSTAEALEKLDAIPPHAGAQVRARAALLRSQIHLAQKQMAPAHEHAVLAVVLATTEAGDLLAQACATLAEFHALQGIWSHAVIHSERGLVHVEPSSEAALALQLQLALALAQGGHWEEALQAYSDLAEQETSARARVAAHAGKANALRQLQRIPEAIQAETSSLEVALAQGLGHQAGTCANNLGLLKDAAGLHTEAQEHYRTAELLLKNSRKEGLEVRLNHMASLCTSGKAKEAARELPTLLAQCPATGTLRTRTLLIAASANRMTGNWEEATELAEKAVEAAALVEGHSLKAEALQMLASMAEKQGLLQSSRDLSERAIKAMALHEQEEEAQERALADRRERTINQEDDLFARFQNELAKQQKDREQQLAAENYRNQLSLLQYQGDLQKANTARAIAERDRTLQALALVQAHAEGIERENSLELLTNRQRLQQAQMTTLTLEKAQQEATLSVLKAKGTQQVLEQTIQRKQRTFLVVTASLLLVLVVLAGLGYVRGRKNNLNMRRQKQLTDQVNKQLAQRTNDMDASLRYARQIQASIVPQPQQLSGLLPQSHLLYRPRDTVSGDLPFVLRVGPRIFLASIDCTGHGVPAAMLSFMAYYTLRDLLNAQPQFACGDLLDGLHARILLQLDAHQGRATDGMDIGLCCLDPTTGTLSFAGANTPLFVQRGAQVEMVQGNKGSIGDKLMYNGGGFRGHRVQLAPGDRVFMCSDGVLHQFGGGTGNKKFGRRRLMEHFAAHAAQPMGTAGAELDKALLAWQGGCEQTDDMLLLAFEFVPHAAQQAA
jgi:serine phosphatase RsbU (regulator of sigma subunit)